MARFLFVTVPVTGHVSPLLSLAQLLVERGHALRWYTGSRFQRQIEATGAQYAPYHAMRDLDYENLNAVFPERAKLTGLRQTKWDLRYLAIGTIAAQLGDLTDLLADFPADVIVCDVLSTGAMHVAEKYGLPLAVFNPLNLVTPSRDTAPNGLALPPSATALGRVRNKLLNWLVFRVVLRDLNQDLMRVRASLDMPPVRETMFEAPLLRSDLFLQPTIPAFEYPRSDSPDHLHFIGALLPNGAADHALPDWWPELESGRPVILVTQGTMATDFDQLLRPALRGLAEEDALVLATTGSAPADGLGPLPPNVRLASFIPYARLMPHVDVMVTNGGYGGTHFALTHGVPLVAGGLTEDKSEICARIAWAGVGINLKTNAPTPAQVRRAVRTVLADPSYKQKAQAMQAEFARHDARQTAIDLLENLAAR